MVSVVIPTYNERENLQRLLPELLYRFSASQTRANVIVVDDASPDGTQDIVAFFQRRFPHRLHVCKQPPKQGLGAAYRVGFKRALELGATIVVQMDADGSHAPQDLFSLLLPLRHPAIDVVVGSRYVQNGRIEHWSRRRRALSRLGTFYARTLLQSPVHDMTSGFRAWKKEALANTQFPLTRSNGYAFQVEMIQRAEAAGATIVEVPITFTERREGVSKLSPGIVKEAALLPWQR